MSGSGAFHGLKDTMLRFDIEGAINHFVFKVGDLNFNAKTQYSEFVIEQKATVDRREVRKPESELYKPLTERIRKLLIPLQVLLPTCRRFSLANAS